MNSTISVYTIWVDGKVHLTNLHSKETAVYKARKVRDSKPDSTVKLTRRTEKHALSDTLYGPGYGCQGSKPVGAARSCPLAYTYRRGA